MHHSQTSLINKQWTIPFYPSAVKRYIYHMRKTLLSFTFFSVILSGSLLAQQGSAQYDSISTYDVNLSDYMTTNGRVYLANGKAISKEQHQFYKDNWAKTQECQPCMVYTYTENKVLKHIALQYGDCLLGAYKEFHPDGKVKIEGTFKENTSATDWSNLRMRGLCSVRHGQWTYYNTSGKVEAIEQYENGKLISREEPKDSVDKPNALQKMKGLFKKSGDEE